MKTILLVLIPSFIGYACSIGAVIYQIVKKPNYFGLKIFIFVGILVFLFVSDMPCYRDLSEKNTNIVTAEYIKFQSSNTLPCTRKAFFRSETGRFYVYIPIFTRDISKLESGKTYEIEYFNNSHIIKEFRLIE